MKIAVVVPVFNGQEFLAACLDSLLDQSQQATVVVVDNGSSDASADIIKNYGSKIEAIYHETNLGFTGGVNAGITWALERDYDAVALFNDDAVANRTWLEHLTNSLKNDIGIVTCRLLTIDKQKIDSTGDQMTTWGLPYPRGRDLTNDKNNYNKKEFIFGASGGASLYSAVMLKEIGLFDQDFFAYYEDVDVSFRAQLAGWKVLYEPSAEAYHHIGGTSSKMGNFTVYHTFKNMPMVLKKNIPKGLRKTILPRFYFAYTTFIISAIFKGNGVPALRGWLAYLKLIPKKINQRHTIQAAKKVSNDYIFSLLTHDLPENSHKLRKLRSMYWKITGKHPR